MTFDEIEKNTFGDCEISWFKDEKHIAEGYFGSHGGSIGAIDGSWEVKGQEAEKLRFCGKSHHAARNDRG